MSCDNSGNQIDLGFADECEPWLLTNRYFPSKIGQKPAWLDLQNLPKNDKIACPKCKDPRIFLCQVYAPIEENENCFHRTIFVFICKNEVCNESNASENILVLRSQLQKDNSFYSSEPPNEEEELPPIACPIKLCALCGCRGPLICSRCKKITYCSQKHQRSDWKHHKVNCNENSNEASAAVQQSCELLFPEFEIIIEPESIDASKEEAKESEAEAEKRRLQEYEKLSKEGKTGELKDIPDSELALYAQTADEIDDKQFRKFKKRIQGNPTQVLRYDREGSPLWITQKKDDSIEVAKCEHCHQERVFEFQIMPQMLNSLKEEKLDWGVIAIYTCKESCPIEGYVKEFVVKQDIVGDA